ncbi:MAG: hypothetical protein WD845_14635 [Pirellulales bacterium]
MMMIAFPEGIVTDRDIERLQTLFPEAFVTTVQVPASMLKHQ